MFLVYYVVLWLAGHILQPANHRVVVCRLACEVVVAHGLVVACEAVVCY